MMLRFYDFRRLMLSVNLSNATCSNLKVKTTRFLPIDFLVPLVYLVLFLVARKPVLDAIHQPQALCLCCNRLSFKCQPAFGHARAAKATLPLCSFLPPRIGLFRSSSSVMFVYFRGIIGFCRHYRIFKVIPHGNTLQENSKKRFGKHSTFPHRFKSSSSNQT